MLSEIITDRQITLLFHNLNLIYRYYIWEGGDIIKALTHSETYVKLPYNEELNELIGKRYHNAMIIQAFHLW